MGVWAFVGLTMLVKVLVLKHFASGSLILSQLARIGMHENAMVCW